MTTSPAELQAIREPVKRFALIDLVMATHIGGESYVRAADFDAQSDEVRRLREALGCHAYASSDKHLSGYRLTLGFDTLEQVQAAHQAVVDLGKRLRAALGSQP